MMVKRSQEIVCEKRDLHDMNSIFLDTNFFLDIFDSKRERYPKAKQTLEQFLANDTKLYTSSDIISTISYFLQKKLDLKACVVNIDLIVQEVTVLSHPSPLKTTYLKI